MRSKGYFRGTQKTQSGSSGRIFLCALLIVILLPSVFILINYVKESRQSPFEQRRILTVSLYHEDTLIAKETGDAMQPKDDSLFSILFSLRQNLTPIDKLPDNVKDKTMLRISLEENDVTTNYRCYFDLSNQKSVCLDDAENAFSIAEDDAEAFLCSSYSQMLYKSATPPELYTTANDMVTPAGVQWLYRNYDGIFVNATDIATQSKILTYGMAGSLELRFTADPDRCTVTIFRDDEVLYRDISHQKLPEITVDTGSTLRLQVTAEWADKLDTPFRGSMQYDFYIVVRDRAQISLDKTSLTTGQYALIRCENVPYADRIQFACSPDLGYTPEFFQSGNTAYALLPFATALSAGDYEISITYGATVVKETVTLKKSQNVLSFTSPLTHEQVQNRLGESAISEWNALRYSLRHITIDHIFFRGSFTDYTESGSSIVYRFGAPLFFTESEYALTAEGMEYTTKNKGGSAIPVANAGQVIWAGHIAHLGNLVVVEHGLGLRTWYAGLSEIDVREGDALQKGQSVGKAGRDVFSGKEGFILLCTVFDVPIDYTNLSEFSPTFLS